MEKAMAPHSSTLAWKIPWTEDPGGLLSMGSHRVGHDWNDLAAAAAAAAAAETNKILWSNYVCELCCVQFFLTSWTVAHQVPLSMEFSRQEYWSGLPFPTPGDLPNPGIESTFPASPALAGGFFTTEPPRRPKTPIKKKKKGRGWLAW